MVAAKPGSGSAYAIVGRDSQGRYFDGSKTYKITLPAQVPAARFWSFTIYDNQTRSMLETDQASADPGLHVSRREDERRRVRSPSGSARHQTPGRARAGTPYFACTVR
jgi:hypothetical protein